jgi:uncharacterized FlaG/YvyC family protein
MATIENLGAALIQKLTRQANPEIKIPMKRAESTHAEKPVIKKADQLAEQLKEVKQHLDSSTGRGRARENLEVQRMSLDELAEMLRKINLTFDLFEIQARFTINRETGDISVQVVNQRTGEVIRKIPPYEVSKVTGTLLKGEPLITDIEA